MKSEAQAVAQELTEALADAGKIIEGGWDVFRIMVIPKEAPQIQVREMWMAFFAGAQHLFASIMAIRQHHGRDGFGSGADSE